MSQKNELLKVMKIPLAIYVHYPFCRSKCPYCDFNSHVAKTVDHESFLKAYETELESFGKFLKNRKITSIFFGGGTPSLMPTSLCAKILQKISQIWEVDELCEITLEANPTSIESQKFAELKNCGINRLSLGIQALNDADLKFLGREHSAKEAMLAIETAQKFFKNFSFDLIYARPNQTVKSWRCELETAISFGSKHLSLYQLTIEKGTKFFGEFHRGKFTLPPEEIAAELFEATNEIASKAGFENYEISNYGKNSFECRHNLQYWQGGEYLGIGAGAHSRLFFKNEAVEFFEQIQNQKSVGEAEFTSKLYKEIHTSSLKLKNPAEIAKARDFEQVLKCAIILQHEPMKWLSLALEKGIALQSFSKLSKKEVICELILMGLRLKEGICETVFLEQIGKNFEEIFGQEKLERLEAQGLICIENVGSNFVKNLRIPEGKRILTNAVIAKLLDGQL